MPIDTSVKFFHSGMQGLNPLLTVVASSGSAPTAAIQRFFDVFSAVFVSGFNTVVAQSLSVTNNVATLTFANSLHGFEIDGVIAISGATPTGLNGEQRVISVSGNTVTFTTEGVSNGAATGTISVKYAPLGWEYVGTTPTVPPLKLKSPVTDKTSFAMLLDYCKPNSFSISGLAISAYNSFDSTNLLTLFGERFGSVSANTFTTYGTDNWILIGDKSTFYFLANGTQANNPVNVGNINSNTTGAIIGAGLFKSISSNDMYNRFVHGAASTSNPVSPNSNNSLGYNFNSTHSDILLSATINGGLSVSSGNLVTTLEFPLADGLAGSISHALVKTTYPNSNDSSLVLARKAIGDSGGLRGYFRGLYQSPQSCATAFNAMDRVVGQGALSGKRLLAVRNGVLSTTTPGAGVTFFDITGPWE